MYGYQGTGSIGKEVVLLVVFLLVAAFCLGVVVGDSYWGNPAREDAEAERTHIENRDLAERQRIDREAYQQQKDNEVQALKERQRIDLEAYQQQKDGEVQALKERAQRALWWRDRWNELGMVLATAAVVGLLAIAGVWIAAPVTARAYERYAYRRAQLVEQEIRLQRTRVALAQEQDGGNGRERGFRLEQSMKTSSRVQASRRHDATTD